MRFLYVRPGPLGSALIVAVVVLAGLLLLPFLLLLGLAAAIYIPWKVSRMKRRFRQSERSAAAPAADEDCVDVEFKTVEAERHKLE